MLEFCAHKTVRDAFVDVDAEEYGLLTHNSDVSSKPSEVKRANVPAIEENLATHW